MPLQYLFLKIETKPIFPVLLTSVFRKLKFLTSMVNFCPHPPMLLAKLRLRAQEKHMCGMVTFLFRLL